MENECEYISSRGILKSCNIHNISFASSDTHLELEQYSLIKENDLVYVNNSAILDFFKYILPFESYHIIHSKKPKNIAKMHC